MDVQDFAILNLIIIMSSLSQEKWDLAKDLNLVMENLDHLLVANPLRDNLSIIRNCLLECVVFILHCWWR